MADDGTKTRDRAKNGKGSIEHRTKHYGLRVEREAGKVSSKQRRFMGGRPGAGTTRAGLHTEIARRIVKVGQFRYESSAIVRRDEGRTSRFPTVLLADP